MFRYRSGPFKPHLYRRNGIWFVSYDRDRSGTHIAHSVDFALACRWAR
jgi:hypothetical protein